MYYIVYKTTNLVNGKYYIGKHQTEKLDDGYLGSGTKLLPAIEKYGKENFKREILFQFDNWKDMNDKEAELVNESVVNDRMSYNVGLGGQGGPMFKGKKHTQETIDKIKQHAKDHPQHHSEETRKLISQKQKGKKLSIEHRKSLSDSAINYWKNKNRLKIVEKINPFKLVKHHKRQTVCEVDRTQKRVHIHKDKQSMRVFKEELDYFFKEGWSLGRPIITVRNCNLKSRTGKYNWIHNENNESKRVKEEELDNYLSNGWIKGRDLITIKNISENNKGKQVEDNNPVYNTKWMFNENLKLTKMIKPEDFEKYSSEGWQFGSKIKNKDYKYFY